jgi:hypothetical protein
MAAGPLYTEDRLCLRQSLKEIEMRPEHDLRRKVIREWMSFPRDKRQSQEQAAAFAEKVVQANTIGSHRDDPREIVMAWLSPRVGRTLTPRQPKARRR